MSLKVKNVFSLSYIISQQNITNIVKNKWFLYYKELLIIIIINYQMLILFYHYTLMQQIIYRNWLLMLKWLNYAIYTKMFIYLYLYYEIVGYRVIKVFKFL